MHISAEPQLMHAYEYAKQCVKQRHIPTNLSLIKNLTVFQGSHCPDVARAAAKFLSNNLHDHDLVLVSGDLAASGVAEDLSKASQFICSPAGPSSQYINKQGAPTISFRDGIAVMPGNHDRFRTRLGASGGSLFEEFFHPLWKKPLSRVRVARLDHEDDSLLFVVIGDFCLWSNTDAFPPVWPFYTGQGTVNFFTLRQMEIATAHLRSKYPSCSIIWVSHFPPVGVLAKFMPELVLNGWMNLISAAKLLGIDYVISGHIHEAACFNEQGVEILCAGALCTFNDSGGNWIHSLSFEVVGNKIALVNKVDYRYDDDRTSFVETPA